MDTFTLIVLAGVVAALGLLTWMMLSRRRNERLKAKYGPEYARLAREAKPGQVAKELGRREKRVEAFHIRPLTDQERDRFAAEWQRTQARFVDDPAGAVIEADRLVGSVMTARGYPVAEFEQRAADISVDHPIVVEHYRAAHGIALKQQDGRASTEELRQGLVHYRALFSELLEEREHAEVGP